jgi:hypothetical protein
MQPRSPAWRIRLSTRLREQRVPSVLDSAWTLGAPYVRRLRSWISRSVSVRTPSSRFLAEDGLPDYIVSWDPHLTYATMPFPIEVNTSSELLFDLDHGSTVDSS